MASKSSIEWTEATWNPLAGCSKVSPACQHCYAIPMARRLEAMGQEKYQGLAEDLGAGVNWTGIIRFDHGAIETPMRWKRPRRIFVNSMSDLFHERVPVAWIDEIVATIWNAQWHTFQSLTKRPERQRDYFHDREWPLRVAAVLWNRLHQREPAKAEIISPLEMGRDLEAGISNWWLGVTIEDQKRCDERLGMLLETPAAVRFVSCEPLLGPLDLGLRNLAMLGRDDCRLDWVIVGGESGCNARPMHPGWARFIQEDCAAAGVAFFFKQWGEWLPISEIDDAGNSLYVSKRKAGPGERQDVLDDIYGRTCKVKTRSVQFDGAEGFRMVDGHCGYQTFRVGKAKAGRLLDGREFNEFPKQTDQALTKR